MKGASLMYVINAWLVFPCVLLWTFCLLVLPTPYSHCGCNGDAGLCEIIQDACKKSPMEVLPFGAPVIYRQTLTTFSFQDFSTNLTHLTAEIDEEENFDGVHGLAPYSYFTQLFPFCILLHLAVVLVQLYFLEPFRNAVEIAEQLFHIHSEAGWKSCERVEEMKRICCDGPSTRRGFKIFKKELTSLLMVYAQLIIVAWYMHDVGSGQMWNWLSGNISINNFIHNEFPQTSNCRLVGDSLCYLTGFSCYFNNSLGKDEMLTTCYHGWNFSDGVAYVVFYLWSYIFAIWLTLEFVHVVVFLLSPSVRKHYFMTWAQAYRHDFSFTLISKEVSAFEALYLLRLWQTMRRSSYFNAFTKVYFQEVQDRSALSII